MALDRQLLYISTQLVQLPPHFDQTPLQKLQLVVVQLHIRLHRNIVVFIRVLIRTCAQRIPIRDRILVLMRLQSQQVAVTSCARQAQATGASDPVATRVHILIHQGIPPPHPVYRTRASQPHATPCSHTHTHVLGIEARKWRCRCRHGGARSACWTRRGLRLRTC